MVPGFVKSRFFMISMLLRNFDKDGCHEEVVVENLAFFTFKKNEI